MNEQLYIENQLVDLPIKSITRKIRIGDIADISTRKSTFSYTFNLPRTKKNIKILDFLGVNYNTSRAPYTKLRADYIVEGILLISNGYVNIKKTAKFYQVNIFDGTIDLAERLKGKKLTDLNFYDLNHYIDLTTYTNSFSNTQGYIYAIGDFGLGIENTIDIEKQAPCIYSSTLWDKIFNEADVSFDGDFFTTNQDYLTEVITPSKGNVIQYSALTETGLGSITTNTIERYELSPFYISHEDKHTFLSGDTLSGVTVENNNDLIMTFDENIRMNIDTTYSNDSSLILYVKKNNTTIGTSGLPNGNGSKPLVINLSVVSGDTIHFDVKSYSDYLDENEKAHTLNISIYNDIEITKLTGGQYIDFSEILEEIDQIDFIKDIMNRYGLILHPIPDSKDYRFTQIDNLLNDITNVDDWTDKLNYLTSETYNSGYAQSNLAKYKYTTDVVSTNFDGILSVDNENSKAENTLFTSLYEIPLISKNLYNQDILSIPIWELNDGEIELKESPIKCLRINRIDTTITVEFFSGGTSDVINNIPFLSLDNMDMDYFIANYYKAFGNLLDDYKEIEISANLNLMDIYNLNFFKLKYLKQTGRYYYLNSVTHNPNKNAKVQLIEINSFNTNLPPTTLGTYSFTMNYNWTKTLTIENFTTDTTPQYHDPEFNDAYKIKILSGFTHSDILLKQSGTTISSETEILVNDLALTIEDIGTGTTATNNTFTFTIQDTGSGQYSNQIGNIIANVDSYTNNAPVANAGADSDYDLYIDNPSTEFLITLNGSASTDDTGDIVSYNWTLNSKPSGSNATVTNGTASSPYGYLVLPNEADSGGQYTVRLTVEDEYGLTDIDDRIIDVRIRIEHP